MVSLASASKAEGMELIDYAFKRILLLLFLSVLIFFALRLVYLWCLSKIKLNKG